MIVSDEADHVLHVVDEMLHGAGGTREEIALEHDADRAAGVGDRADLRIREVAPVRMHRVDAGVRDDERQRAVVRAHGVEEGLPADVREIDERADRVELADVVDPELREPVVLAEGRGAGRADQDS